MCKFFSFVQTEDNKFHYLDEHWRCKSNESGDSHSLICMELKLREDYCNKFEYCNGSIIVDNEVFAFHIEDVQEFIQKLIDSRAFARICLEAVKQNGRALQYIKEQTHEVCLEAVKQNGCALQYVKEQSSEICLEAVKQNGRALYYVKERSSEICLEAVKQNGRALQYVNPEFRNLF